MNTTNPFLLAAGLFACLSASALAQPATRATPFRYSNPLDFKYDQGQTAPRPEIRDPCIIRDGDAYYLVFTMWPFSNREDRHLSEPNQGGSPGMALYSSKDLEGPWLEKIAGRYCLFYAANYTDKSFPELLGYRTGVAYADSMAGPWRKDPRGAVFFGGHLAVFDGPDGKKWFLYRNEKDSKNRGLLCIDPIDLDANGRVQARETIGPTGAAPAAWHPAAGPLMTRWAADVTPAKVLPEYPRPQLAREKWQDLNGLWDYAVSPRAAEHAPLNWDGRIMVPYCIESALSGVMKPLLPTERLWYRRSFRVPADWRGGDEHLLLHFGAVDWECTVYVNGKDIGSHRGGYDAFTVDATDALTPGNADQEIVLSVWTPADSSWQLHGKQSLHPAGCSYTACSGVWQTVWAEPVETAQVSELKLVTDIDPAVLHLTISGYLPIRPYTLTVSAYDGQTRVAQATSPAGPPLEKEVADQLVDFYHSKSRQFTQEIDLPIPNARLWSPDTPFLYDLKVELKDEHGRVVDRVTSYFGMRKISLGRDNDGFATLEINGKHTVLAGALDQGYWPDGIYTAPTDDALRYDLEAARQLGINCLRKHVKVEPQRWYYWADKLGILVMQDMPTGNEGDAFTDKPRNPEAAAQCESEMRALIRQRWNHPSIIGWVMYNEGWGQHDTLATAQWAKQLDPTRLIDEANGFPWHGGGDVRDHHGGAPGRYKAQIGIVSENGGWGLASPGHDWSDKPWTYTTCDPATAKDTTGFLDKRAGKPIPAVDAQTKSWFTQHIVAFYKELWDSQGHGGGTGNFFCQLIDVENECDGLLSYDRAVFKVDPGAVRKAARGELSAHADGAGPDQKELPR